MAVRNIGGHGVTNMAGAHHMEAHAVNMQYQDVPAHQSGGMVSPKAKDVGAYASRSLAKAGQKKFPPAK